MGYSPSSSYPNDLAVVKKMVPIIGGDKVLEDAYFDANITTLKENLDAKQGGGTNRRIVGAIKAGNHGMANKLLDEPRTDAPEFEEYELSKELARQ